MLSALALIVLTGSTASHEVHAELSHWQVVACWYEAKVTTYDVVTD